MTHHVLKSWPEYFDAVKDGRKTFEVRQGMDRTYEMGDEITLLKWYPGHSEIHHCLQTQNVRVVYVVRGVFGLPDDVWVFGIERVSRRSEDGR